MRENKMGQTKSTMNNVGNILTTVVSHVESQAAHIDTAIIGAEHARERMPLPEEYGTERSIGDLPLIAPQMPRLVRGIFSAYMQYKRHSMPTQSEASTTFLKQLEAFAHKNGALAIGYAKITPELILLHYPISMEI